MKKYFKNYRAFTNGEIRTIWKNGLFIPDSNVLISLYRFPDPTKNALLDIFKKLGNKLWIPHQVAQEFYQNRLGTIYDQEDAYDSINAVLDRSFEVFEKEFNKLSLRHPFIDSTKIKEEIRVTIDSNKKKLNDMKKKHPRWSSNDKILEELESIFEGKTGEPYEQKDLIQYYQEAEDRYKLKIPPGYEDIKKDYPFRYGDYIVWKQVMDKAKKDKKSVIFITDDQKEDWWLQINGKRVGARYELLNEFNKITGKRLFVYQSLGFIGRANSYLKIQISPDVKAEIKNIKEIRNQFQDLFIKSISEYTSNIESSDIATGPAISVPLPDPSNTNVQQSLESKTVIKENVEGKKQDKKK